MWRENRAEKREASGLVEHLVTIRLKPEAAREDVEAVLAGLRGLRDKVPGILDLSCGWNFSPGRDHGFHLGVHVRFVDRAALAAYGPHPEHQAVLTRLRQVCDDILAIDYECP